MKRWTIDEARRATESELARLLNAMEDATSAERCNLRKDLTAWENVESMLDGLTDNFTFESETYDGAKQGIDREYPVFNIGTFAEQALQFAYIGRVKGKAKTDNFDHTIKRRKVEYKATISPNRYNTAYNGKNDVLLIIGRQVVYMDAETAVQMADERGRFKMSKTLDYESAMTANEERAEIARVLQEILFGE